MSLKRFAFPISIAAASLLLYSAAPAFAASHVTSQAFNRSHTTNQNAHRRVQRGEITAVTATSITLGSTTYTLAANVSVHYHEYSLSVAEIPVNTKAVIFLNGSGVVTAIRLSSDPSLPAHPVLRGTITAISSSSITIDGYTLPVSANVTIKSDGQTLALSAIPANAQAIVHLNRTGTVVLILLTTDVQAGIQGTVTADTPTSITIGTTTYTYAPNVTIRYRQYTLTPSEVPVGSQAMVTLNSSGQAATVILLTDSSLPNSSTVQGTISSINGTTLTINSYSLSLAANFTVTYEGTTSLTNTVTTGETAIARLNTAGQISQLIVEVSGNSSGSN
ncbi:MAG: hypothetical protein C7B45_16095 [Sulfobacillus acidophilus]|uniref:DUF5666 domain-containing protein n=1 Tax=Sulfobacillus acidophilus TaxID=53633 RepID=A0A2T2WD58_9FIRM|nr:MAG: hypothetical protein C7B45_16095 [Sulfobacillus acidophilus]